jgi:hypothetical protein
MAKVTYRFELTPAVPLAEAEMSLHLAMMALEGLFGRAGVRLDARYRLDKAGTAITVDGSSQVGESLVRVFAALLIREFGDDSFGVRRVCRDTSATEPTHREPAHAEQSASSRATGLGVA